MEKEIKVRKKRFAAFWIATLLMCGMLLPMTINAVDTNGLVSLNEPLVPPAQVRAGTITYLNANGESGAPVACSSGGWQTVAGFSGTADTGYTFSHWEVTSISSEKTNAAEKYGQEYGNVDYPNSITVKPVFTLETYTITYDLDGGTGTMVEQYTMETETFTLAEPTKPGCTFTGWTNDKLTEPTKPVTVEKGSTGALSYKANWKENTYNIEYVLNGGTNAESNPTEYTYATGTSDFADASREGYTFAGWYSDEAFTTKVTSVSTTDTGDITLYAKFEYNSGKIQAGTYYLKKNTQYQLDGVQHVSIDTNSVYDSDAYFYVPEDGSYTFS